MWIAIIKQYLRELGSYAPILTNSIETGIRLHGGTKSILATIPRSVYGALTVARLIKNPYYEESNLSCEWEPNRWWMYQTTFSLSKKNVARLVIEEIDYIARIYLNGNEIGRNERMFSPVTCNISNLIAEGNNYLTILLECTPNDSGQYGYTSQTFTQRYRFDYKWSFCTFLVGAGIYGNEYIENCNGVRVDTEIVKPYQLDDSRWNIPGDFDIESDYEMSIIAEATLYFEDCLIFETSTKLSLHSGMNKVLLSKEI